VLFLEEILESYYKVSYPDGRIGYIKKSESEPFELWMSHTEFDPEKLTSRAFAMLGVPYLWGGTSSKAMDCSGFTKTVYLMNGYIIPRDASQQENIGTQVDDKKAFEKLQKGDLLFFGRQATDSTRERVVHVGMWIGDMKFIHASGDIHVSSMDPDSDIFDEYNLGRYLRTMRLAGSEDENNLTIEKRYFSAWQVNY
jgi:cell wall-associated NlpC family hydrolase